MKEQGKDITSIQSNNEVANATALSDLVFTALGYMNPEFTQFLDYDKDGKELLPVSLQYNEIYNSY